MESVNRSLGIEYSTSFELSDHDQMLVAAYVKGSGGPSAVSEQWKDHLLHHDLAREPLDEIARIIERGSGDERENNDCVNSFTDGFAFSYGALMAPELTKISPNHSNLSASFNSLTLLCDRIYRMIKSGSSMSSRPERVITAKSDQTFRNFKGLESLYLEYGEMINPLSDDISDRVKLLRQSGFGIAGYLVLELRRIDTENTFRELLADIDSNGQLKSIYDEWLKENGQDSQSTAE